MRFHIDLRYTNGHQSVFGNFLFHAHARQKGYAEIAFHHPANGFHGGHFDVHIELYAALVEAAQNDLTIGREYVVRHEDFIGKLGYGHIFAPGQSMFWRHYEDQGIGVNHGGKKAFIARLIADYAEFEVAIGNFARDTAGKTAAHLHLDTRIETAVFFDVLQ